MPPYSPKKINRQSTGKGIFPRFLKDRFSFRDTLQNKVVASPDRQQWGYLIRGTLLFALIGLLVVGAGMLAYLMLAGTDIFRLTTVTVVGNRTVSEGKIIRESALVHGTCLLKFDVDAAETRIAALSWVDKVELVVSWPSRITINIREHKPFAIINLKSGEGNRLHYVDYKGNVFIRVGAGYDLDFPVISGDIETSLIGNNGDEKIKKESPAHEALKLLRLAARGNTVLPGRAVSEVSVDYEQGLILFLVEYPFPIYMGNDNIRTQYFRLVRVLARLYRHGSVGTVKEIRMNHLQSKALVARFGPVR